MSPPSRPTWAGTWPWAGHRTMRSCAQHRWRPSPTATSGPAAFPPNIGRRRCTWQHSRCPASLPSKWREQERADFVGARHASPLPGGAGALVRDVEIELDEHIVRVIEEDLPAGAIRHLIDAERHAFLSEMVLDGVEAATAEG